METWKESFLTGSFVESNSFDSYGVVVGMEWVEIMGNDIFIIKVSFPTYETYSYFDSESFNHMFKLVKDTKCKD